MHSRWNSILMVGAMSFAGVAASSTATRSPEVTVANTPAQPVPVTVISPNPVPVTVISPNPVPVAVMSPVRSPFQQNVSVSIPAGIPSNTVSFAVPAGFRLVIEYVSGSVRVSDKELVRVNVSTSASGASANHTIPNNVYRRDFEEPTSDDFIVTYGQSLKLYADPGSTVFVTATRSENAEITPTFFALALSGYLVECGPTPGCPIF